METNTEERLAERVRELWSTNPSTQMKLFRTLRAEGYSPGEIMLEIQALRSGGVRKEKKTTVIDSRFVGCQRNDAGEVVDPFTLASIDAEDLVSYETKEGKRFCFDRKSLYRQFLIQERAPLQNPFTRKLLPSRLQQEVVSYGESLRTKIEVDEQIFVVEPFISVGEFIVSYLVSLGSNYLQFLEETNLIHEGKSLYLGDLQAEAQSLEGEIHTYLFTSQTERDTLLTNFFQFLTALRTRALYNTIYLYLGELLEVIPLVPREDGFDLVLRRDMTVLEVVRAFYMALQVKFGGNVWREYDIVTEEGDSLSDFNFYEPVLSELPGENLHYVPYESKEDADETVEVYLLEAFYTNDRELLDTINTGQETLDFNWTITDFFTYMRNFNEIREGESMEKKVKIIIPVVERIDYNRYEVQDLVTNLIKHFLTKKRFIFLKVLLLLFRRLDNYDERHALFQFELAKMRKKHRRFIAERLAGEAGRDLVVDFYEEGRTSILDLTLALQLDDVPLFNALFSQVKRLLRDDEQLREMCNKIEKSHVKLYQVLLLEIEPKYSWKALFGQLSRRKYKKILDRVSTDTIHEGMSDSSWLVTKTDREHFRSCLQSLVSHVDDKHFPFINWNQCYQIFYIEGAAEIMPQPMTVAYKVCMEDPTLAIAFVALLNESECQMLLHRYPSAPGFERALAAKVRVVLPPVGNEERTQLVRDVCHGDYELLLELLISRGEDAPIAVSIILNEELFIVRKTASYLLTRCSYEDCLPLLEKYYDEQAAFGILPQEYFERYLHKY